MTRRLHILAVIAIFWAALDPAAEPATRISIAPSTQAVRLGPGEHFRRVEADGRTRSYYVHVPPSYDPARPTPLVLAFHGAWMNGPMMSIFSGLNAKADAAGFVVAYPNGTGIGELALFFNAWAKPHSRGAGWGEVQDQQGGQTPPPGAPDDVAFAAMVLDDLESVLNVDRRRVFATGMSNGGMMCHRLAAELSDRIAAVAPVAGTLAVPECRPTRPVSVIHFHGTADTLVPFNGRGQRTPKFLTFKSVEETIRTWVKLDGCPEKPVVTELPVAGADGIRVTKKVYGPGREGAEVVLVDFEGGGHTWPGRTPPVKWLGRSTASVSANDLMWEFFLKHPMAQPTATTTRGGTSPAGR